MLSECIVIVMLCVMVPTYKVYGCRFKIVKTSFKTLGLGNGTTTLLPGACTIKFQGRNLLIFVVS